MDSNNNHLQLWTYRILAILLPFVFLLLVELVMRWCEYGYNTDLFIEDKTGKYYLLNPDISKKYFTIAENATIGNYEFFQKEKQPGTMRIFVLGESSSLGFPYMHNGAFPRMLKYRLQFAYPDTHFEVINLSLTAINSYTLYDFSKQLIDYDPDAILVYAGHNEYYGALGVAATSQMGDNTYWVRAMIAIKNLKIAQWLFRVTAKLQGTDKHLTDYSRTLMERMTHEQSIPYQSPTFRKGINQFDANLSDMSNLFNKHGIPVFLGTLASNLRDMEPFASSLDSLSADKQFQLGNEAYAKGDTVRARAHYILAKDYDELRFRAPEAMNEIIRKQAESLEKVHVVDVLNLFETYSPYAIPDSSLLLEHVHPNLTGQRLISDAFYDALDAAGLLQEAPDNRFSQTIEITGYPLTAFDTIYGDIAILMLKELWPFNKPMPEEDPSHIKSFEERIAGAHAVKQINWYEAMQHLYEYYSQIGDNANALRVMEGMCLESPFEETYFQQTGKLCLQQNEDLKAWFYFMKVNTLRPSTETTSNIAIALLKMDMPEKAIPYIDAVIRNADSKLKFRPMKEIVEKIILLKQQLSANPDNHSLRREIASNYQIIGNDKAAAKYLVP